MKRFVFIILFLLSLNACSSRRIPDGEYSVFSYRQTITAVEDSALISAPLPCFCFDNDMIRIYGDFGKAHFLHDTLYRYTLRGDYISLDSGNEVKEYRFNLSEGNDCIYIDLELLEKHIQELTLALRK